MTVVTVHRSVTDDCDDCAGQLLMTVVTCTGQLLMTVVTVHRSVTVDCGDCAQVNY